VPDPHPYIAAGVRNRISDPLLNARERIGTADYSLQTRNAPSNRPQETAMPRGAKSKYTAKQERKADHIAEGYEKRGVNETEAERRAWATVNKDDGGGKMPGGSGRGKKTGRPAAHKGGELGGRASAARPAAARRASARKAAATRKRSAS